MLRNLDGRRIALVNVGAPADQGHAEVVRRTLEQAGAEISILEAGKGTDEDWHGGRYAALVVLGGDAPDATIEDQHLTQLAREFLVSEKPVAAMGQAVSVVIKAGGAGGRTLASDPALKPAVEAAGAKSVDDPIHSDGCLISAQAAADIQAFAQQVVREFTRQLEERDMDAMSEQSFPASDPPATTPASIGPIASDEDASRA